MEYIDIWMLGAVAGGLAEALVEFSIEVDGEHRHLDIRSGGELGAYPSHALAGRSFALVGFALNDEDVGHARFGEMPGDAGADDASANDSDVCGFHDGDIVEAASN